MKYANPDPFRNFNTYKIDPVTEIRNAGIVTAGDVYWVSATGDSNHTTRTLALGKDVVKIGIQEAVNETVSDHNDYVLVIPQDSNGSWGLGTALDIDEDRVHLLSVGYTKTKNGYSNTILGSTGTTPDTEIVAVTGNAVEVGGFHVLGTVGTHAGGTLTNGVAYVNAHEFWAHDSFFELSQNANKEPYVLTFGGTKHGARFDDCSFAVTGTGDDEGASGVVSLGAGGKGYEFHNCVISTRAGSTTSKLIVSGTGSKDYVLFKNCDFINQDVSIAVASAITGSVTVDHPVLCMSCSVVGCAQLGTDPSVYLTPAASGTTAAVYNPFVAIGTAAIAAK